MGKLLRLVECTNERTLRIMRALTALTAKREVTDVIVLYMSSEGEHFVCTGRYKRPAEAVNALVRMKLHLARQQNDELGHEW